METRKIGIMGGTFNPIHMGHLILAETAREEFGLDEILFLPNHISYTKRNTYVLAAKQRVKLTELAIEDNPFFSLSTMEIEREGYTYTYETLQELHRIHPQNEYYFIMGADSLFQIENWKCPELIFANAAILTAVRPGHTADALSKQIDYLRQKFHGTIFQVHIPEIDISSTDIRNRIAQGKSVRYRLPDKVREYIEQNPVFRE